ncbi:MAG: hydroxypyruvate isomerase family protein [Gemmobacter sp.]
MADPGPEPGTAPRIAANITMLFAELAPLHRPAAARAAGFDGIEVLFPYDDPPEAWADACAGIPVALINTPPGDWAAGARGHAAVPGAEARFRDGFRRALDLAAALAAGRIHVMAGIATGPQARATYLANLEWAADFGHPLTIEPLNPADMPGYMLNGYDAAADILDTLAIPHLGLQFDTWHAARLGGVMPMWRRHGHRATHLQIAGEPVRAAPDAATCAAVRTMIGSGYAGWIAAEYRPRGPTTASLDWVARLRP